MQSSRCSGGRAAGAGAGAGVGTVASAVGAVATMRTEVAHRIERSLFVGVGVTICVIRLFESEARVDFLLVKKIHTCLRHSYYSELHTHVMSRTKINSHRKGAPSWLPSTGPQSGSVNKGLCGEAGLEVGLKGELSGGRH